MHTPTIQDLQSRLRTPLALRDTKESIEPITTWTTAGQTGQADWGRALMAQGACGCIVVAGGQGTRLGYTLPKGQFPVTVIENKSLFQRLCERVRAASELVGRPLPLAIMTSHDNDYQTRAYFAENHHFGLDQTQLVFFTQGALPLLTMDAQPFADVDGQPAVAADGNGAVFQHFVASGIAARWQDAGIHLVSFIQVDNALADPFDAELLGFHAHADVDVTIKATWREDPQERVGVIVRKQHKLHVIEYTEIAPEDRERRDAHGQLVHALANLSMFCFSLDFIQKVAAVELPLHIAKKEVRSQQGNQPAYKFEHFVFDALPLANKVGVLAVARRRCFAPLKNRAGTDSADTVHTALQEYDRLIYEELTGRKPDPVLPIELSARWYYPTVEFKKWCRQMQIPTSGYLA